MSQIINPVTASIDEIEKYLAGGKYISSIMRQKLMDELEIKKRKNSYITKFNNTNNSKPIVRENIIKKKININDKILFPELARDNNFVDNNSSKINFKNIIKDDEINSRFENINNKTNYILYFHEIEKIYQDTKLSRIQIEYLSLLRKIDNLDQIQKICCSDKSNYFKRYFKYDDLTDKLNRIYDGMSIVQKIFNIKDILLKYIPENISDDSVKEIIEKLDELSLDIYQFAYSDDEYISIQNIIIEAKAIIIDRIKYEKYSLTSIILDDMINDIINDIDPGVNCDICIYLYDSITNAIVIDGLSSWLYLEYNNSYSLIDNEKDILDDTIIKNISIDELTEFFNYKIVHRDKCFLDIMHGTKKFISILIYFDCEINYNQMTVKVKNKPYSDKPYRVFTQIKKTESYIHDNKINKKKIIIPKINFTNGNKKYVDFIFSELMKNDNSSIISKHMENNFRKMIYKNSYYC